MFAIRYVEGHRQKRPSDSLSFSFVYGVCLILAAYLMGFLLFEEYLNQSLTITCSVILLIILLLPSIVPIILSFSSELNDPVKESLLPVETIISEDESEVEGKRRDPQLGENFTLLQALGKTELWLTFVSLILGSGSGITIIDNMGQISDSLGYSSPRIFVSIISVCNFLGRVGGGYFSEIVVRKYAYPRLLALAIVQSILAIGLLYYALGWPASIYTLTVLTSFGYGAHWGIAPAAVSEMFGLKCFGSLYNFIILSMPTGSFLFSSILASRIYDYYAETQGRIVDPKVDLQLGDEGSHTCIGRICYSITCAILTGVVCIAVVLSLIVVRRTRTLYTHLYAKSQA
uniref:Nodulin-like domain-containing protein n=1 Tax=Chenopodium quinoa TaxID=63459 RepID=A0A803N5D0_CHEQI